VADDRGKERLILLSLVICSLASVCSAAANSGDPEEVQVGGVLPEATMQGLNGPSRSLMDFRGRPLIINVWASWCGPCRNEMASLERLAWRDESRDFSVIGISTDDYPERASAMLNATNATISHFIDSDLYLEKLLGASRLPLTVLVDADGRVVEKIYGAKAWDTASALLLISRTFDQSGEVL
jgi:thiol-disulfide isomerase/thioredoxin